MYLYDAIKSLKTIYGRHLENVRRTGRSSNLSKIVRTNDVVIFINNQEARHFQRKVYEVYNVIIIPIIIPPDNYEEGLYKLRHDGCHYGAKVYLDHRWIDEFIKEEINKISHHAEEIHNTINDRIFARDFPPRNIVDYFI